mgnify:CR=1 FL=1
MENITSLRNQTNLPRWFSSIWPMLENMKCGGLLITLPDERVFKVEGHLRGPTGDIVIHNNDLFGRLIREGENGFCEAYMDAWWETSDLLNLLDVFLLNNNEIGNKFSGVFIVRIYERLRHWLNSNTKFQAKRNIAKHYDLGNDFYSKWLDETMTYSSALFKNDSESLEQGQRNKYDSICENLNLKTGDHVLEIGCGWGGFAEYAIKNRGLKVTGLTISKAQQEFAQKRLFDAGLADQANIILKDYRNEKGIYDGIASIEMFEAVGEKYWPAYFQCLRECLKQGRNATMQIITVTDDLFPVYRKNVDFIQKYIFPGGMLPCNKALEYEINKAGLVKVANLNFGLSYSKTLRIWHEKFNSVWSEIAMMNFDDRFRRMWNFYLASCAAVFQSKTSDVIQLTVKKN